MSAPDPHDTISDMIRFGTVESVEAGFAVVNCADIVSPPLRWMTLSGLFGLYYPLSVGQQVVVLCPDGDIAGGLIFGGIPCDAFPLPGDGLKIVLKMPDGTVITYDADAHTLTLSLAAAGKIIASAPGGFEFTGKSKFTGDMTLTGKLDASDKITSANDVVAGAVSLKTHKHTGVTAGAAQTGVPA